MKLSLKFKGGPGSGFHGHKGREGQVGGSSGSSISASSFKPLSGDMKMGMYNPKELQGLIDKKLVKDVSGTGEAFRLTEEGRAHFGLEPSYRPKMDKTAIINNLSKLATNDYQKRNGGDLRSDVAESIQTYSGGGKFTIEAMFKNTTESSAKRWLDSFVYSNSGGNANKLPGYKVDAYQTGDYEDDWVTAVLQFDL